MTHNSPQNALNIGYDEKFMEELVQWLQNNSELELPHSETGKGRSKGQVGARQ
jgi:hypothetical protein